MNDPKALKRKSPLSPSCPNSGSHHARRRPQNPNRLGLVLPSSTVAGCLPVDRCTPKTSKHHTMQIASNSDGAIAQETEFDVDIGPRSLIQLFALTAPR
ncbi:unnamed protein product, partial [Musa banksii]